MRRALRSSILRALADLDELQEARVVVTIDGWRIVAEVTKERCPADLSETERTVLDNLSPPCTAKMLADRCGYSFGGWFRGVVADMVRAGLIVRKGSMLELPNRTQLDAPSVQPKGDDALVK